MSSFLVNIFLPLLLERRAESILITLTTDHFVLCHAQKPKPISQQFYSSKTE